MLGGALILVVVLVTAGWCLNKMIDRFNNSAFFDEEINRINRRAVNSYYSYDDRDDQHGAGTTSGK